MVVVQEQQQQQQQRNRLWLPAATAEILPIVQSSVLLRITTCGVARTVHCGSWVQVFCSAGITFKVNHSSRPSLHRCWSLSTFTSAIATIRDQSLMATLVAIFCLEQTLQTAIPNPLCRQPKLKPWYVVSPGGSCHDAKLHGLYSLGALVQGSRGGASQVREWYGV